MGAREMLASMREAYEANSDAWRRALTRARAYPYETRMRHLSKWIFALEFDLGLRDADGYEISRGWERI